MFFADVTKQIVFEKIIKKYTENKAPDSSSIRKGTLSIKEYMNHISWLIDRRNWLAGNDFTVADISAAAQISCVDYVGSVEWSEYPIAKDWYVRIKSRPSFREILADKIADIPPSSHYAELDF
jgi:glutathione S-transferase